MPEGRELSGLGVQVGVNASSRAILERLVRADTASAFNISVGDVKVTGVTQVRFSLPGRGCVDFKAGLLSALRMRPLPTLSCSPLVSSLSCLDLAPGVFFGWNETFCDAHPTLQ